MRPYRLLSLEERRKIERWRAAKISVDVIAQRLGRDRCLRKGRAPKKPKIHPDLGTSIALKS